MGFRALCTINVSEQPNNNYTLVQFGDFFVEYGEDKQTCSRKKRLIFNEWAGVR